MVLDGFFLNAPILHYTYEVLDRWIPAEESHRQATLQVAIDIFILDPVYALIFMVTTGLLQGFSFGCTIIPMIRAEYATVVVWLIIIGLVLAAPRVYLFKRFPVQWRVLISDFCDLLWTVVTCSLINPTH